MVPKPLIAIIGAGPAGLTLARILHLSRISFRIYERDADPYRESQGGTLDIHAATGQRALHAAGLIDAFRKHARYEGGANKIADLGGKIYADLSVQEGGLESDRPEIDRKDLRDMLLASVPKETVKWGAKVAEVVTESAGEMRLTFAEGHVERGFRLVVGADGAWSKARALVTDKKPKYSGLHSLTSPLTAADPCYEHVVQLVGGGNYFASGGGRMLGVQRMGDGSYMMSVTLRLPETWTKDTGLAEDPMACRKWLLAGPFADAADTNRTMIRGSRGKFRPWPLYQLPDDSVPWQTRTGVTLVGDAAHLTVPDGEGVNNAMFDSWQLAQQIIDLGVERLDEAVGNYEQLLAERASGIFEGQEAMYQLMADDAPRGFLQSIGLMDG